MFTPKDLYERITALRQQEGLSAAAATEKLARKLSPDAEQIWSDCGAWFLAQVEQQFFKSLPYAGRAIYSLTPTLAVSPGSGAATNGQDDHDAHRLIAVQSGSASSHGLCDAQQRPAAGTPWPLRVSWNWDVEFAIPQRGRKRLRDITGADWLAASNVHRRGGETLLARSKLEGRIAGLVGKNETTYAAFQRTGNDQLRFAMKQLIGEPKAPE